MKLGDLFLGIFILTAVVVLIIPVSPIIIDIMITINLTLALIILFNSLFAKEALSLSSFPTLILFTTIFRISINLASTKGILSSGANGSGEVIKVFGQFVGQGNLVIGAIVFLILVIVNFMVITKGSERVAEVSARFTLDAMPGKQMAIDADLNAGLIDELQAKERREKIQDEASFYGAMDGASKFVKGDAIAGLLITGINIIAGIITGVLFRDLPIAEAASEYTILTIGDGLVSQIPALLISLSTGILVTKVSKEAEVSNVIIGQLFSMPRVLYMSGAALVILGLFTPLNKILVSGVGFLTIVAGRSIETNLKVQTVEEEISTEEVEAEEIRRPENVVNLLQIDPIELEFGYGIIPLADASQGGDLLDRVVMIRRQIAMELGTIVPIIRLRDNIQLNPNQYIIKIKGNQVADGEILFDHYMAMNPGYIEDEIDGIETIEPAFKLPAMWITESQRERAEAMGYTVVDPPSIIATHLTEVIKMHLDELLTRQNVQTLVNNVNESNPALVDELVPKLMSIGDVQKVLMNLLREGISIRDLVTIFETMADYAITNKDPDILTEYVRQALKRTISAKFLDEDTNHVLTLDPSIEQMIMDAVKRTEQGTYISLEPQIVERILNATKDAAQQLEETGRMPIILTSPIVRVYFKSLVEERYPQIVVISYNEIDSNVELQSVGMVSV